jgi:HEAT repeat protein
MVNEADTVESLLLDISEGTGIDAFEAAKSIGDYESVQVGKQLVEILKTAEVTDNREAAAYALCWFSSKPKFDFILESLLDILESRDEPEELRGQAAEGVGYFLIGKSKGIERAKKILLECLRDESPAVRFWSCFAVGQAKIRAALPILEDLRDNDHTFCPDWWYISEEAEDAIRGVKGLEKDLRIKINRSSPIEHRCPVTGKVRQSFKLKC